MDEMATRENTAPPPAENARAGSRALLCTQAQQIGDITMSIPHLRHVAKLHGGSVDLLVKSRIFFELYAGLPFFGHAFYLTHWKMPFWIFPSWWRFGQAIRANRYDAIYALEANPRKRAKIVRLATLFGIERQRVRFDSPFDVPAVMGLPELRVSPEERAAMEQRLARDLSWHGEPLVLVHPGNSRVLSRRDCPNEAERRFWPEEHWAAVAAGAAARLPEAKIIFTGSAGESELTRRIVQGKQNLHSWAGSLSLRELLALQSLAHSQIANDTGPAHTSLAVGCPNVILYIAKDPRTDRDICPKGWGPALTLRSETVRGEDGEVRVLRPIRPETVLGLWEKLPPRSAEIPTTYAVTHYREGSPEGETTPA